MHIMNEFEVGRNVEFYYFKVAMMNLLIVACGRNELCVQKQIRHSLLFRDHLKNKKVYKAKMSVLDYIKLPLSVCRCVLSMGLPTFRSRRLCVKEQRSDCGSMMCWLVRCRHWEWYFLLDRCSESVMYDGRSIRHWRFSVDLWCRLQSLRAKQPHFFYPTGKAGAEVERGQLVKILFHSSSALLNLDTG